MPSCCYIFFQLRIQGAAKGVMPPPLSQLTGDPMLTSLNEISGFPPNVCYNSLEVLYVLMNHMIGFC